MKRTIGFTKVSLPYGWMGNMSPYGIYYNGKQWRTAEALFQSMRFDDEEIIEAIRLEKSPMGAKFKAKGNKDKMQIDPMSNTDLDNMRICVMLKFHKHKDLAKQLIDTGDSIIYEDVSSRKSRARSLYWGAYIDESGNLVGENYLGIVLMEIRSVLKHMQDKFN